MRLKCCLYCTSTFKSQTLFKVNCRACITFLERQRRFCAEQRSKCKLWSAGAKDGGQTLNAADDQGIQRIKLASLTIRLNVLQLSSLHNVHFLLASSPSIVDLEYQYSSVFSVAGLSFYSSLLHLHLSLCSLFTLTRQIHLPSIYLHPLLLHFITRHNSLSAGVSLLSSSSLGDRQQELWLYDGQ